MRAIAKVYQPKDSSTMAITSEEASEEDTQVVAENDERDENVKATTKENEGWMRPMKLAPIMNFDTKSNESNEESASSGRHDRLSEDEDVENKGHEDKLEEERKEKMKR